MTFVELWVHMDCPGCESRIRKALQKLDGVDDVDIDMDMQKITVTGYADQDKVLKTVRKTGRKAELWPFPYNPDYHGYVQRYHQYYSSPPEIEVTPELPYNPPYNYISGTYSSPYNYISRPGYSTYNYREHGYSGHGHGYYPPSPYSHVLDEHTSSMFSDENATGCSIM